MTNEVARGFLYRPLMVFSSQEVVPMIQNAPPSGWFVSSSREISFSGDLVLSERSRLFHFHTWVQVLWRLFKHEARCTQNHHQVVEAQLNRLISGGGQERSLIMKPFLHKTFHASQILLRVSTSVNLPSFHVLARSRQALNNRFQQLNLRPSVPGFPSPEVSARSHSHMVFHMVSSRRASCSTDTGEIHFSSLYSVEF